jgi:hypothetical protein
MRETNMNKISRYVLGMAALLCSTAGMAGTVEVRPNENSTAQPGACLLVAGRCELTTTSSGFYVIVHGISQPDVQGVTLGLEFSQTVGTGTLTWQSGALSTVAPTAGTQFDDIVNTTPPDTTCPNGGCIITVLNTAGADPNGTVDAMVLNFTMTCSTAVCEWIIDMFDDGSDFSWNNANTGPIANTYTQGRVVFNNVPVPAAAWLMVSGLASLAGIRRLRRQ